MLMLLFLLPLLYFFTFKYLRNCVLNNRRKLSVLLTLVSSLVGMQYVLSKYWESVSRKRKEKFKEFIQIINEMKFHHNWKFTWSWGEDLKRKIKLFLPLPNHRIRPTLWFLKKKLNKVMKNRRQWITSNYPLQWMLSRGDLKNKICNSQCLIRNKDYKIIMYCHLSDHLV